MTKRKQDIPLYVNLTEKKVMVAGEGQAAEQMAGYLAGYTDHLFRMTGTYRRCDLYGMDYVVSVLDDPSVNDDICVTCRTLGIRVYIAADPGRSDFFLSPQ